MDEPTERVGRMSLMHEGPQGPMLRWDNAPQPDTTLAATGIVAVSPEGRIYFSALCVEGVKVPAVGSDELRMVPVTAMLTAANGTMRKAILMLLDRHGDPTATELLGHDYPKTAEATTAGPPALRFDFPKVGGAWPNSFYEAVAVAYRWLVVNENSRRPALDLAEKNGVPVTTVHRWIAEARRRGVLEPGVRGRAGS